MSSALISGEVLFSDHRITRCPDLFCVPLPAPPMNTRSVPLPHPPFFTFCCKQNHLFHSTLGRPMRGPWVTLGRPLGDPCVTQTQSQSQTQSQTNRQRAVTCESRATQNRRASNCHRSCRRPKAGALSAVEGDRRSRESNDLDHAPNLADC